MTLQATVQKAALFLDHEFPGWAHGITRPVRMDSPVDCVLGQIIGEKKTWVDIALEFHRRTGEIRPFTSIGATPFWQTEIEQRL